MVLPAFNKFEEPNQSESKKIAFFNEVDEILRPYLNTIKTRPNLQKKIKNFVFGEFADSFYKARKSLSGQELEDSLLKYISLKIDEETMKDLEKIYERRKRELRKSQAVAGTASGTEEDIKKVEKNIEEQKKALLERLESGRAGSEHLRRMRAKEDIDEKITGRIKEYHSRQREYAKKRQPASPRKKSGWQKFTDKIKNIFKKIFK